MPRATILHTIETGGPGGAETVFLNLLTRLDRETFRSLAMVPVEDWLSGALREHGVEPILAPGGEWPGRTIARLAREYNVDLIHAHLPDQNFFAAVGNWRARRKLVATYHGKLRTDGPGAWRDHVKLAVVRRSADVTVAVSHYLQDSLRECGFDERRLAQIYNGVDTGRFRSAVCGRLRAELGVDRATPIIGMVANLRVDKNYEAFVRTARLVADRVRSANFVAVGHVDARIGERVRRVVEETRLGQQFHLLGFRPNVPEMLADMDVFCLTSTSEGLSIATIEAMAAGVPVVVTRSGGPQEIVEDGRTGLLVPPSDPEAMSEAICRLIGDRQGAARIAGLGRSSVEQRFSVESMIQQYELLYGRVLGF